MDMSKEEKEWYIAEAEAFEDASPYGVYAVPEDKGEPHLLSALLSGEVHFLKTHIPIIKTYND